MASGKIIGGLIGLFTAGPIGAIIGIFIGHLFDKGYGQFQASESPEALREVQETFFSTAFTLIGYLAKADGRVSEEEIQQTQHVMNEMGLTADHKRDAIQLFKVGSAPDYNPQETLAKFKQVCGTRKQLKQTLLMYLFNTALADGHFDQKEEEALRIIASGLGISAFVFEQLLKMVKAQSSFSGSGNYQYSSTGESPASQLKTAYEALGVSETASDSEVKKAYRKLMSQYHPDKLMGQGVPDDMIKTATERSQEVQRAYDLIKKSRSS